MRSYAHLSEDERDQIGVLRAAGRSMGAIARVLGRAKATISRELQRNALPLGGYSPLHAAGAYQLRRQREAILDDGERRASNVGQNSRAIAGHTGLGPSPVRPAKRRGRMDFREDRASNVVEPASQVIDLDREFYQLSVGP